MANFVQRLPFSRREIEKCIARNFCIVKTQALAAGDELTICDFDGTPCCVGKVGSKIEQKVITRCRKCLLDSLPGCGLCWMDPVYVIAESESPESYSKIKMFGCVQVENSRIESYEKPEVACPKGVESRWMRPGVGNVCAIFQCPGFDEMKCNRVLVDDTGCNFNKLIRCVNNKDFSEQTITVVNSSPIPHRDGFAISDAELKRFSSELQAVLSKAKRVICFGEVAYRAYKIAFAECNDRPSVMVVCHLSPSALHWLQSKQTKVSDDIRIGQLAKEICSFLLGSSAVKIATTWEEFRKMGHGEFVFRKVNYRG